MILTDALQILRDTDVLRNGHFVLNSGRHAPQYVNKDALYPHTAQTSALCRMLASFADPATRVVAAPAIGGVILSQWVAHHLGALLGTEVLAVYAESGPDDTLIFKRGYDQFIPGSHVLVVEDVLTTGDSAKKVVTAIRTLQGEVTGVCTLFNRGGVTVADLGNVPWVHALVTIPMESYLPEECPLCTDGIRINTDVGKGKEFPASQSS
jgi:orotate phosphoribosyltransferase